MKETEIKQIDRSSFVKDIKSIIDAGRRQAYGAVSQIAIATYWSIGRRIVKEEQKGEARAEYGSKLIEFLSEELTAEYGSNFGRRNLEYYRKFYLCFSDLEILHTRVQNLSWSHIRRILHVSHPEARLWYLTEAAENMWSVRTLDRNISTQYYERRLASQREGLPLPELPANEADPTEYIKNPVIAEFLGLGRNTAYEESDLEQALIDNLQKFIMELGRGFAFVERQKHVVTETDDFYIDLVFYNFRMKSFVLFELKTHRLTHQDIGQLDMYVRMYDDMVRGKDDNPTIGVLLCTDTDTTIAKYSVLHDNDHLFAAKYMPFMPTEEELRREIEQQKQFFIEQQQGKEEEE